MTALIGIDVGATAASAIAIDEAGRIIASASADYPTAAPRPGWAEQDPADWWRACSEVLTRVAAQSGPPAAAIAITGQAQGTVFLDDRGVVVRPAIVRNDRRAVVQSDDIRDRIGDERLIEITGSPAGACFQAARILWLRDVEPVQFRHVRHVMAPKDYIRLRLTGELATDATDASGTLLFDIRRRDWSGQLVAALDIPRPWLPAVRESGELAGYTTAGIANEIGLPAGIPLAMGAAEYATGAIATGIATPDCAGSSIDTRGILLEPRDALTIDPRGRLQTLCSADPSTYHLVGITPSAGTSIQWWRTMLGGRRTDDELIKLTESVPPGADGLIFLSALGGEGINRADANPRGAFVGLRAHHTPAHLTRAVMEGVVFSLRYWLDVMREVGSEIQMVRATGVGGRRGFWRRLQADIFNLPVQHTLDDESPAFGAALLAGVTAGVFRSVAQAAAAVRLSSSPNHPDPNRARTYEPIYSRFRELYASLQPVTSIGGGRAQRAAGSAPPPGG